MPRGTPGARDPAARRYTPPARETCPYLPPQRREAPGLDADGLTKVRILHLPQVRERASDLRKRRSGALSCGPAVSGSNRLSTGVREEYGRKLRNGRLLGSRRQCERSLDAYPRDLVLAIDALGVDPAEDIDAVPGPLRDLLGGTPAFSHGPCCARAWGGANGEQPHKSVAPARCRPLAPRATCEATFPGRVDPTGPASGCRERDAPLPADA